MHGKKNLSGSPMEWQCGRPAAPWGAARMLAARSPPGRWRRWRQETENDKVARRREPSERRGRRGQPGAQHERDERPPWRRRSNGARSDGRKLRRTPTLRTKCRITGSGKTLKIRTLGCARSSFPPTDPLPSSLRSRGRTRRTSNTKTQDLYWFGPPLCCNTLLHCGGRGLHLGLMMNNTRGRTAS